MMRIKSRKSALRIALLVTAMVLPTAAMAQDAPVDVAAQSEDGTNNDIVVTGSRLRRPAADGASPISVTDRDALEDSGQASLGNVVANLTINTGSQFNSDLQGQGGTVGTAGFNLRGLGLNSTLVLLNGTRSVEYAINNNVGDTFVDVNSLVPQIAIQRMEILKDGAAALYGSDAVAGVANFITRSDFSGVEVQAGYQDLTTGSQPDYSISGIVGGGTDRFHAVFAVSYTDRDILTTGEKPQLTAGRDVSPLGQPGTFIPLARIPGAGGVIGLNPVGPPTPDPLCGNPQVGGLPDPAGPGARFCRSDVTNFNTLLPSDRRIQLHGEVRVDLTDDVRLSANFGYASSQSEALGYPGNPLLFFPIIPANNPGNPFRYTTPFGPPGSGQFIGDPIPVRFLGRAFGPLDGGRTYVFRHDLARFGADLRVKLPANWEANLHYGYGQSAAESDRPDLDRDQFIRALACQAGPNNNLCFNPFANSRLAAPGSLQFNSQAVLDVINVVSRERLTRDLHNVVLSANGNVLSLPGGDAALAVGVEYRGESINGNYSDLANRDGLAFFLGDPDFKGSRSVWAGFAELGLPITSDLDLQLAARFESYPTGSSFNPKVGAVWRATDAITVRGSYGTSFRAPNLFQLFGFTTGVEAIDDPLTGQSNFNPAIRTNANRNLANENSNAIALGVDFSPVSRLRFSVDYWRFDFKNRIVREVPQQILNANPLDPRVIRDPATFQIQRIDVNFINAASFKTDGVDFTLTYNIPTDSAGTFAIAADATRVLSYDIRQSATGPAIDGLGNRNFSNIGVSSPAWRGSLGLNWSLNPVSASITGRYIDAYRDDRVGGTRINDQLTVDANVSINFAGANSDRRLELTVGAINLFDTQPPSAISQQGFDATTHDPRGRVLYARVTAGF
jgi:iron complex outermembrane recepter protein